MGTNRSASLALDPPRTDDTEPNGTPNDNMNALRVNSALKFPSVGKKTATKSAAPQKKSSGFSFGSKKTAPPKKSSGSILSFGSKKTAQPKKTVAAPVAPAQSFVIRIPGQFFQSKKDIVWPVTLGFTKSNELFVGRMAMLGFASSLIGDSEREEPGDKPDVHLRHRPDHGEADHDEDRGREQARQGLGRGGAHEASKGGRGWRLPD